MVIRVGVPLIISVGIHWTLYFLGAVSNQARFFTAQLIIIPLFVAVIALVYWLNKKIKKKQTESPLFNPSITNRGWMPKEPNISSRQQNVSHKTPAGVQVGVVVFIMACAGGLLGALGLFSELGVYLSVIVVVAGITVVAMVNIISAKQKEKQQGAAKT